MSRIPYRVFFLILVDALAGLLLLGLVPQRLRDLLDREVGVAALHELLQGVVDELVLVLQYGSRGRIEGVLVSHHAGGM